MNDQSFHPVTPDEQAIARHLDILFGYLDGFAPIRLFPEIGTPLGRPETPFLAVDPELAPAVVRLAQRAPCRGFGVFVVPGVVARAGGASADDVAASGALLIDLDHGDIAAKRSYLERNIAAASLVIASGGITAEGQDKLHLYWRLTEGAVGDDLKTLARLRAIMAARAGGDTSFDSIHQPIRIAGTVHGKNGVQRLVRIVEDIALEYELADLVERVEALPTDPAFAHAAKANRKPGATIDDLMTERIRAGGEGGETRYAVLSRIIGHWIRQVRARRKTLEEAWEAVRDHNTALIEPPWPHDRLRREFLALLKVDVDRNGPMPKEGDDEESVAPPELSEDSLAAMFVAHHGREWRHVAAWGAWLHWNGARWLRDDTLAVREVIRQVCRHAVGSDIKPSEAKRVASERTIRAVERIASADQTLAARVGDWDNEPLLINTPSGVIDLETGEMFEHDPALMLTHLTNASPGSASPRWTAFLSEVTGGDDGLVAYL